jgi:hypothetical protein
MTMDGEYEVLNGLNVFKLPTMAFWNKQKFNFRHLN